MPHLLFPQDEPTSLTWKPCLQGSTLVLSCHIPHPTICLMTLNGGQFSSNHQSSQDLSQAPDQSRTYELSQMLVQALESATWLDSSGGRGAYSQTGTQMVETLDGQKWLVLSFSPSQSSHPILAALTTRCTETTKELSKGGGKAGVEINKQTLSSTGFTPSWAPKAHMYIQDMSPAVITQLTTHLGVYTLTQPSFSPIYPSLLNSTTSLQTSTQNPSALTQTLAKATHQSYQQSPAAYYLKTSTPLSMQSWTTMGRSFSPASHTGNSKQPWWNVPLPPMHQNKHQWPAPYHPNLSPLPSPLRPHCPANQRLQQWHPLVPRS